MKDREKDDLRMLHPDESQERATHSIMEEIREENDILDELEAKIHRHKKRYIRKVGIVTAVIVGVLTVGILYVTHQTYTKTRIINTYSDEVEEGEQYIEFAGGILKYTRDGAAFVSNKGKEKWNAAYQIQTPIVSVRGGSAAIADKGGNDISVFGEKGLRGEVHTSLPIEKIAVSSQGIVSTILKDGNTFRIVCYDAAGNVLIEHKTSPSTTGYPMDLDISDDGYMLLVSYLMVKDGMITGRAVYYNFGDAGKDKTDYIVKEDVYSGSVIPTVFFMDKKTSVVVADHEIAIYEGDEAPKKVSTIKMENGMKSVFHDDTYIGAVANENGKNELQLYNKNGKRILSQQFIGEYKNAKIADDSVIMYSGKRCSIFSKNGVQRFAGEFDTNILEIKPLLGLNKYLVINTNGFEEIRFAK